MHWTLHAYGGLRMKWPTALSRTKIPSTFSDPVAVPHTLVPCSFQAWVCTLELQHGPALLRMALEVKLLVSMRLYE